MKYRKFAGRIPKIRNISKKKGYFFEQHVDVHMAEGSDSCGQGRGRKPDFRMDVINGWPLKLHVWSPAK